MPPSGTSKTATAEVRNDFGSLELQVLVSAVTARRRAHAQGALVGFDPAGAMFNVLNGGFKSDMGESTAVHSVEVVVRARPTSTPGP